MRSFSKKAMVHALAQIGKGFKPNWSRSLRDQWIRAIHALRKHISHSPLGFSRGKAGLYHEGSLFLILILMSEISPLGGSTPWSLPAAMYRGVRRLYIRFAVGCLR